VRACGETGVIVCLNRKGPQDAKYIDRFNQYEFVSIDIDLFKAASGSRPPRKASIGEEMG